MALKKKGGKAGKCDGNTDSCVKNFFCMGGFSKRNLAGDASGNGSLYPGGGQRKSKGINRED